MSIEIKLNANLMTCTFISTDIVFELMLKIVAGLHFDETLNNLKFKKLLVLKPVADFCQFQVSDFGGKNPQNPSYSYLICCVISKNESSTVFSSFSILELLSLPRSKWYWGCDSSVLVSSIAQFGTWLGVHGCLTAQRNVLTGSPPWIGIANLQQWFDEKSEDLKIRWLLF